jgi:hypothetical protein
MGQLTLIWLIESRTLQHFSSFPFIRRDHLCLLPLVTWPAAGHVSGGLPMDGRGGAGDGFLARGGLMPESTMKPSIWIYGGVHDDPGSRQRFLAELTKQETAPHFVAVEWEKSVFERFAAWRPSIEEGLKSRWSFLPQKDRHELSLGLAWEGDAYAKCFPSTDLL